MQYDYTVDQVISRINLEVMDYMRVGVYGAYVLLWKDLIISPFLTTTLYYYNVTSSYVCSYPCYCYYGYYFTYSDYSCVLSSGPPATNVGTGGLPPSPPPVNGTNTTNVTNTSV
jgi:hypothetical protein